MMKSYNQSGKKETDKLTNLSEESEEDLFMSKKNVYEILED